MSVDARIRKGLTMIEKELPEVETLEAYENLERDVRRLHRRRQAVIGSAAAAVLLVAAAGAVVLSHDQKDVEPAQSPLPNRVTIFDPDGNVSVVADDGTRQSLPVKGVDRFALSPDGSQIAYVRDTDPQADGGRRLWIANADGTDPHAVPAPCTGCEPGFGVTWSNDGAKVAYSVFTPGQKPAQLRIRDLATGTEQVFRMPAGEDARGPRFSPDGRLLAINVATENGEYPATLDPARGSASLTPLGGVYNQVQAPWWSADGRTIYFTATVTGDNVNDTSAPNDLYAVAADGSSTRQITHASAGERFFGVVPYRNVFLTSRAEGRGPWTVGWLSADGATFTPMTGPDGKPVLGTGAQLQP
jgi:dipeptidyl aminopeptidase/acylaminoacyl peptidase